MATAGFKARILNGDFSLSAKLSEVSTSLSVDMLEPTTFADGVKRALPGVDTSTFSASGFIDAATQADNAAWTAAQPFTYGPQGIGVGSAVVMVNALKSSFEVGTQVAGVASFDLAGQTDGPTGFGVSLHDLTAETVDANGTAVDGAAATAAGGVGHLHLTEFSGLTNAIVTIEDSATGSSGWATILTFATATAVTSERVAITGTVRRYLRAVVDVTGTGTTTFAVAFARN